MLAEFRFTLSARRHHIGHAYARYVISTTQPTIDARDSGDTGLSWVGDDDRGIELEITASTDPVRNEGFVIRVMPTNLRRS